MGRSSKAKGFLLLVCVLSAVGCTQSEPSQGPGPVPPHPPLPPLPPAIVGHTTYVDQTHALHVLDQAGQELSVITFPQGVASAKVAGGYVAYTTRSQFHGVSLINHKVPTWTRSQDDARLVASSADTVALIKKDGNFDFLAADGTFLWSTSGHRQAGHFTSVQISGDRIALLTQDGNVYVVNRANGSADWDSTAARLAPAVVQSFHLGTASQGIRYMALVVADPAAPSQRTLHVFDITTKARVWDTAAGHHAANQHIVAAKMMGDQVLFRTDGIGVAQFYLVRVEPLAPDPAGHPLFDTSALAQNGTFKAFEVSELEKLFILSTDTDSYLYVDHQLTLDTTRIASIRGQVADTKLWTQSLGNNSVVVKTSSGGVEVLSLGGTTLFQYTPRTVSEQAREVKVLGSSFCFTTDSGLVCKNSVGDDRFTSQANKSLGSILSFFLTQDRVFFSDANRLTLAKVDGTEVTSTLTLSRDPNLTLRPTESSVASFDLSPRLLAWTSPAGQAFAMQLDGTILWSSASAGIADFAEKVKVGNDTVGVITVDEARNRNGLVQNGLTGVSLMTSVGNLDFGGRVLDMDITDRSCFFSTGNMATPGDVFVVDPSGSIPPWSTQSLRALAGTVRAAQLSGERLALLSVQNGSDYVYVTDLQGNFIFDTQTRAEDFVAANPLVDSISLSNQLLALNYQSGETFVTDRNGQIKMQDIRNFVPAAVVTLAVSDELIAVHAGDDLHLFDSQGHSVWSSSAVSPAVKVGGFRLAAQGRF